MMGGDRVGEPSKKADPTLNDLVRVIRMVKNEQGHDAFVMYRQGLLSKVSLIEHIAVEILKLDGGT